MSQTVESEEIRKTNRIIQSIPFLLLVKTRNSYRYLLSILVIFVHAFFIGGIAFYNDWFGRPYVEDSIIPNGIFYAFLVILVMIILEFIYIFISDNKLDNLQSKALKEAQKNDLL